MIPVALPRRAPARRLAAACLASLLVPPPAAAPIDIGLDPAAIADAVRLARSDQATLERFHAAYRLPVGDPVIRYIEVVTEFRRIVQLSEERERLRDSTWDATRAQNAARGFQGLLDLVVYLQFSPKNTFRSFPPYSLAIYRRGSGGAALAPIDLRPVPSYVAAQPAPPGTPILAGTVTATFDATRLDTSAPCLVAILLDGREVKRVAIDLGSVR